ncbi:MAG TPA: hypothetical protein VMI75_05365 [Polyangiaceae bacterium]|nr:hypothetical protein [Polyangiaceae bacterium]
MRFAALFAAIALQAALGCEASEPTRVPGAEGFPIAFDAQPVRFAAGGPVFFDETLKSQLARRNIRVVGVKDAAAVAQIDLGVPGYQPSLEVYLVREGKRMCAGRLLVPDHAVTTMDVAAEMVAEIIAKAIVSPDLVLRDPPCST